jgi:DHA1 family tetracycline resistance protein-like MFS transporter
MKKNARSFFPVLLTYFLDNFGLAIIYPIFTPLLLSAKNSLVSDTTPLFTRTLLLGLLIAAFPLAQFFGAPLIGQFSDRFGRKKAFYITILGTSLGYTFTAISIAEYSLAGLFISRFATGLFAGNLTLCLAAVADMNRDEIGRTKNFGTLSAMGGLSFIIAIAFGGIFSDPTISRHFGPSFPLWITAVLSYLNLVAIFTLFHETHKGPLHPGINPFKAIRHLLQAIQSRELRSIYGVNFLFMLAWVGTMQFLPTLLLERYHFPLHRVTTCLVGVGLCWSLSNLLINRWLAKYYFPAKTLLICLLLLSAFLISTLASAGPTSFLILFYASALCAALCWTNGLATISLKAPLSIQGSILGINQSMTSLAAMISPIIGGFLISKNIYAFHLFGSLACLLAGAILFAKTLKKQI